MHPAISKATLKAALLLLTAVTAGCQARTHSSSAGSSGNSIAINDPGLNMQAATLTFPAGWQAQGEIDRSQPCSVGSPLPQFRVQNQAQQMFILHMLPFYTYSSPGIPGNINYRSCGAISQLTHASDILTRLIAPQLTRGLQGAQLGRPQPIPGAGPTQGNGGGFRTSGDSARIHVSYTENGQPREETLDALTTVTYFPGNMGGTTSTVINITSAPQGQLEAALNVAEHGLDTKVSPKWLQITAQQDQEQVAAQTENGKRVQAGIHAQAQANMQNSIAASNATIDAIHRTGQASMQAAANSEAARHDSAQQTAAYVGDKTLVYYWRNTLTGETTTTTNRNSPGRNWVPN